MTWYREGLKAAADDAGQEEMVKALDEVFEGLIEEIGGGDLEA